MFVGEKIKAIDNKIEQNQAQYDLDRQTAKISVLSSGNVGNFHFLTGKGVLPKQDFLEKAASVKKLEYSPLSSELKKQTSVAVKQYHRLNKDQRFEEEDYVAK